MKKNIFVETLRIENEIIYNFDAHKERIFKTSFSHYGTKLELNKDIFSIPPQLHNEKIKCRIFYSSEILTVEYHPYHSKSIRFLRLVEDNNIEYNYKFADRDSLNILYEQRNDADDIIIVKNENITDSSFSNLVFEDFDGELFTPKTYLLAGTKRNFLLKTGVIKEKNITVRNISSYKKVYLINALLDIADDISVPVDRIKY